MNKVKETAAEIEARILGQSKTPEHDAEAEMFGTITPAVNPVSTEDYQSDDNGTTEEIIEDLTPQDWAVQTVEMLDQAKELITAQFRKIEKRSAELHELTVADHAAAEVKMSELMEVEAKFYSHINTELPGLIQKNIEAAAQGTFDAQLELIAADITGLVHNRLADEFNPLLKSMTDTIVNIRLAAADIEAKTGGVKQFLRTAGIAAIVAVVIFTGLKIQFGLGSDAEYGRKAKAAIQALEPQSRTAMESLIKAK